MKSSKVTGWMMRVTVVLAITLLVSDSAWASNPSWQIVSGNWNIGANWNYGLPSTNTGYATIKNGGTATITTAETYSNYLYVGDSDVGNGTCILNEGGTLTGVNLVLGYGTAMPGAMGTFTQNGGTNVVTGILRVGSGTAIGQYSLLNGILLAGAESVGYSGQGVFTQSGGTNNLGYGKWLVVGRSAMGDGTYNLNGGKVVLNGGYLCVGSSGTGIVNQTSGIYTNTAATHIASLVGSKGIYNLSGGRIFTHGLNVGMKGTGSFFQSGGTNTVNTDTKIGAESGGVGYYEMSGGVFDFIAPQYHNLNIGYGIGATGTFVQVGGTVYVSNSTLRVGYKGSHGTYKLGGGGTLELANNEYIYGSGAFIQTGGVHNIGGLLSIKTNGVFRGWGDVNVNPSQHLYMDGTIIADGYGDVDRNLVITNYDRISRNDTNLSDGTNGYYAVHHGKLTLKSFPTGGWYQEWGEYGSHGLVNSVKFTDFSMSDSGVLSGSLYAPDHTEVPQCGSLAKIAGIWGFDDSRDSVVGTADIRFRYDHIAVSNLGLDETTMKVFRHSGGIDDKWEEITDLTRDTAAKTITLNDVNPVGFFAIGVEIPVGPCGSTINVK